MMNNEPLVSSGRLGRRLCASRMHCVAIGAIALLGLAAAPAGAQQPGGDTGGRVFGMVGGGVGGGTYLATGAGAGLRLTRHLGLDVEVTHLSGDGGGGESWPWFDGVAALGARYAGGALPEDYPPLGAGDNVTPVSVVPPIGIEDRGRDVTTFLTRFTVEFPVADGRLFPYLTGGGGVSRVTERFTLVADPIPWIPLASAGARRLQNARYGGAAGRVVDTTFWPGPGRSEIGLSLVVGGGVDVRLWRGLGVGVDLRWLRVFRSFDALDMAQATSRVSYRF